jgi:hypothetical protein
MAAFPYVTVFEEHAKGHGFHLHVLLGCADQAAIARCWTEGSISLRHLPDSESVRKAATYVAKDFLGSSQRGRQRYRVGQGFAPEKVSGSAETEEDAFREVIKVMGGLEPDSGWSSGSARAGTPARTCRWELYDARDAQTAQPSGAALKLSRPSTLELQTGQGTAAA